MRALMSEQPGGPDTLVLRDLPEPSPARGQVRIVVRYCGINYPDALVIEDKYQIRPPDPSRRASRSRVSSTPSVKALQP